MTTLLCDKTGMYRTGNPATPERSLLVARAAGTPTHTFQRHEGQRGRKRRDSGRGAVVPGKSDSVADTTKVNV